MAADGVWATLASRKVVPMRPALHAPRLARFSMPWGFVVGLEIVALAAVSAGLVLDVFPSTFDIEWGCVGPGGELRTSADTYVAAFTVVGGLGWLVATAAATILHGSGRRAVALAIPLAWFGVLVLGALVAAAAIGPISCR